MKKIFSFFAAILFAGSMMADTFTLTNANIVAAGDGDNGYAEWKITDDASLTWNAYAIKNKHSNATADKHFLQIKKYASNTAYYIQIPNLGENIQSITMTVSSTSKAMDGGGNTATVFFSASNSTSAAGDGVASGTGESSITIDASELALQTGYITAGGAVRIWDITVTTAAAAAVAKPVISGETLFYKSTHVKISCVTDGATIYYTLDGSEPDPDDAGGSTNTYDASGINLVDNTTVTALAVKGSDRSEVASKTFTKATVMTVAQALDSLAKVTPIANAYVQGTISKVDSYNETYGSITYWISDDGTTANQLEVYGGLDLNGDEFVTINALQVGDKVTVFGTLKIYDDIKEFDKNNILVEHVEKTPTAIDNTAVDAKVVKTIENGQLVIIKNGVKYNAQGTQIR